MSRMTHDSDDRACPVCGAEMLKDYIFDGEDDRPVSLCDRCGWPPHVPYSVEDWRAEYESRSEAWRQWRI